MKGLLTEELWLKANSLQRLFLYQWGFQLSCSVVQLKHVYLTGPFRYLPLCVYRPSFEDLNNYTLILAIYCPIYEEAPPQDDLHSGQTTDSDLANKGIGSNSLLLEGDRRLRCRRHTADATNSMEHGTRKLNDEYSHSTRIRILQSIHLCRGWQQTSSL